MSQVIHLWDQPTPATWAEAQAVFQRLAGRPAPSPARFVELARRVRAAWPEIGDDWTLDAPDGVVEEAVWSLALARTLPEAFYPRLIDEAVALGLSVLDEQAGECFVPGPWRLSEHGRKRLVWPAPAAVPAALLDVQGRFRDLVLPALAAQGFGLELPAPRGNLVPTRLTRPTPLGLQCIDVEWMGEATSHYDATVICRIVPELAEPVAALCAPQTRITLDVLDTPALNPFLHGFVAARPTSRKYRASGATRLDGLLSAMAGWLVEELLPVLDRCSTLDGFLANEWEEPRHPVYVKAYLANLAIAHGAGVPDLQERFSQLMQRRRQDGMNVDQMARAHEALQTQASEFFGCPRDDAG